ncbi:hypothetical protein KP509_09G079200 [Ceratopteris richardii]|uniref:Uncharacterized protein n=1 Tax=Ceratopteris richardii TaxID=49495 RepID=A0A8T2U2P5_CERRI|nr:hypothetical protein KP509_09G079200 [Ceratopteris richardii]
MIHHCHLLVNHGSIIRDEVDELEVVDSVVGHLVFVILMALRLLQSMHMIGRSYWPHLLSEMIFAPMLQRLKLSLGIQSQIVHHHGLCSFCLGILSLAEHEKLKKATVGPLPGVTLNLQGFKIHSKPSIFIPDTPGVLVPNMSDLDTGLKLALTGAIKDSVVGEERLCRYLLAFLNSRQAPLKWKKSIEEARAKEEEARKLLVEKAKPKTLLDLKRQAYLAQKRLSNPKPERDSVILSVRETLLSSFSSFSGDLEDENDMESLVEIQMHELRKVLKVSIELGDKGWEILGRKILNLYTICRLGNYSLDALSDEAEKQIGHTKV